jgi:hypothetical protein
VNQGIGEERSIARKRLCEQFSTAIHKYITKDILLGYVFSIQSTSLLVEEKAPFPDTQMVLKGIQILS